MNSKAASDRSLRNDDPLVRIGRTNCRPNRRQWLRQSGVAAAAIGVHGSVSADSSEPETKPWLRKTLKYGMIREGNTPEEKLAVAKEAGFEGVEPNVPMDEDQIEPLIKAAEQTGMTIDGTVGGYHWKIRHTDPDPKVRGEATRLAERAIEQTARLGGQTFLLVPGHGKDGESVAVRAHATEAVERMLPHLRRHGITLAIENVWNEMFYDPEGGSEQTADDLARFVDQFDDSKDGSKLVGIQFDIGNHWKFGDPASWIETLGQRIVKLDIKGFSRQRQKFTPITEGDIDWPSVERSLREIKYNGWLAAEVAGGDSEALRRIARQMDDALHGDVDA